MNRRGFVGMLAAGAAAAVVVPKLAILDRVRPLPQPEGVAFFERPHDFGEKVGVAIQFWYRGVRYRHAFAMPSYQCDGKLYAWQRREAERLLLDWQRRKLNELAAVAA